MVLCAGAFGCYAAQGSLPGAQGQGYDLNLSYSRTTLKAVADAITQQVGIAFSYETALAGYPMENLEVSEKGATIEAILAAVFTPRGIDYRVVDKVVVLTRSTRPVPAASAAAKSEVKGVVRDAAGNPMIGVTVTIKGTLVGVSTGVDGGYAIPADGNATLLFSYIGYRPHEEVVGRRTQIDVTMQEDELCTAPQKLDTFGVFFMKYNYEIRLKAVKLVLEGGLSVREAGCHLGCGRSQVHLWVTLFERHGLAGLKLRHGSYSAEFKLSVLKHMHQNHLSLLETAVHFGIPGPFVIRQWERLYQNQGAEGLRRKPQRRRPAMSKSKTKKVKLKTTPHEELLKELEYLRAENAYLKKLQALVEERIVRESGKEPKPSKD